MTIPYLMNCSHDGDGWCLSCVKGLGEEVSRLKDAIRKHRDQKSDDRCFMDDDELYAVLGEEPVDKALPPKCEFLKSCERYWEQRQCSFEKAASQAGNLTIGQLDREISRLRAELAESKSLLSAARETLFLGHTENEKRLTEELEDAHRDLKAAVLACDRAMEANARYRRFYGFLAPEPSGSEVTS